MAAQQIGEKAESLVPALLEGLARHPDDAFLMQAVRAMKTSAIPHLVALVETGDVGMKKQAAKLLNGTVVPGAPPDPRMTPAVDALMGVLEGDGPAELKIEVMGAIASLGLIADPARPLLEAYVRQGGDLGGYAERAISRLDSARKMEQIRREDGR